MNNVSLSFQSGYIFFYILLGLAALAVSWWSYRDLVPRISSLKRFILVVLRFLGIFLIGTLLLEPLVTLFSEKITDNKLGIVVDLSSSMMYQEQNETRFDLIKTAFSGQIPDNVDLQFYGFSDSLIRLKKMPDSSLVAGQATNISTALIAPILGGNDELGALLILTDGAGNLGLDPLKAASTIDIPAYSLVAGSGVSRKDIFISRIDYPPVGYTNTEIPVEVEIASFGYAEATALLEIRDGNIVLDSKRVKLPADGAYSSAEFKLSLAEEGVKNIRAVLANLEDEAVVDNNSRNFAIKLLKDKINILLLSSSINWELTYLQKALSRDPYLDVNVSIARPRGGFISGEMPPNLDTWKSIELVIAMDLGANALGSYLSNLKEAVKAGTGFMYIGGAKSRISRLGDWDELLPVKSTNRTGIDEGEFFPVPGKQAIVRAVTDIDGIRWEELHPLKFVLYDLELDPDAIVFLDIIGAKGSHWPVLVGGHFQRGNTAAITGFPWWPRYFKPAGGNADIKRIEKFWSNLVRWLVAREDLEKFNLVSDKTVYKLGEPVGFSAILFDDSYNLVSGAKIEVVISDSTGSGRELQLTGYKPGEYSGVFGSPAAGKYSYKAAALVQGDTLASIDGEFLVESFSLEMENPSANYALMEQIAAVSGGKSYTIDNFSQFRQDLKLKIKKSDIFSEFRLTGNTYLLILLIVLFTLEWGIRKFSQLA
ncbi:MAG: hypothetical protein GY839_12920 [candidate division Zixibacteria bacterium]|nr:hypothetical protein [candidate division Zixibacteria bacterium]